MTPVQCPAINRTETELCCHANRMYGMCRQATWEIYGNKAQSVGVVQTAYKVIHLNAKGTREAGHGCRPSVLHHAM